jgi:glycerol uptake facilitator-like aquaporin
VSGRAAEPPVLRPTGVGLPLARRAAAEALGTGLLVTAVVGSGIAAQRLSPGDVGLALLENAFATAGALFALIVLLGPVSGAHLNPCVTVVDCVLGGRPVRDAVAYVPAQVVGGVAGALLANAMFSVPQGAATTARGGGGVLLGEVVATFGLVLLIAGLVRGGVPQRAPLAVPTAVAAYIAGAYWFTSSTSFANPAVTVGRAFSDSFAGIAPADVAPFVAAQLVGAAIGAAAVLVWWPFRPAVPAVRSVPDHEGATS